MLTKRLSPSEAHVANKPEWHKTAFRTFMIQIWSRLVKVLKPVPVVAECKPLYFLKHRENPAKTVHSGNKHSQWRLSPAAHALSCWCRGSVWGSSRLHRASPPDRRESGRERERRDKLRDQQQSRLLRDSTSVTFRNRIYCTWIYPFDFFFNGSNWQETQQWLILLQRVMILRQWTCSHESPGFCFVDMSSCLLQELWMTIVFD